MKMFLSHYSLRGREKMKSSLLCLLVRRIHDMSNKYEPINDLNDYLVSGLR
jgi:hypothetical protein